MRFVVTVACVLLLSFLFGCKDKQVDSASALRFLQGIQSGDKKMMYEAARLTDNIVNDSREKLVNPSRYAQTEQQRKDSEFALRISGEIDFFSSKFRKMLPKSAVFIITDSRFKNSTAEASNAVHLVRISYGNRDEAMTDRTNRPVKEMLLRLQQVTRSINGSPMHEFSLNSEDFEKIADKNFEVVSYYQ
ncbi:MAG: hypothetical protein WCP10_01680 [Desulfuromonadales bacterium]